MPRLILVEIKHTQLELKLYQNIFPCCTRAKEHQSSWKSCVLQFFIHDFITQLIIEFFFVLLSIFHYSALPLHYHFYEEWEANAYSDELVWHDCTCNSFHLMRSCYQKAEFTCSLKRWRASQGSSQLYWIFLGKKKKIFKEGTAE